MGLVLSGVQPTGNLHLGNYLGAIKNWVGMQNEHECLFMLADLHAITVHQKPDELRESILKTAALYIACGIDPKKSAIFPQSCISGHSELAWILSCKTPMGWLDRMTQFKGKAGDERDKATLGLYAYPVLMAADILLYNATYVPVGADQKQHLELARDVAGAFNRKYNVGHFILPDPLIMKEGARIMSLQDGTKKMSKSDADPDSRIELTDSDDKLRKKAKKAATDPLSYISYDPENRQNIANLLEIYSVLTGTPPEKIASDYGENSTGKFKSDLAEVIIAAINPIRTKYEELMQNTDYLIQVLSDGVKKAKEIAEPNMQKINKIVGLGAGIPGLGLGR